MFEYSPGNTLLHRLDVRTKTTGFMALMILAFIFKSPVINLGLAVLAICLAFYSGITPRVIIAKLKPLIVIFIFVIIMTSISYPANWFETPEAQRVIFPIFNFMYLTVGGLLYGLTLLFRIIMMIVISSVLIACTPLNDFFQLLQKMAMPYQLAFVLTTAIRFIPTMEKKTRAILDAQNARGAQIGSGKLWQQIQAYVAVMIPMLTVAVRMSDNLAVGMLNRGYGSRTRVTLLREIKLEPLDYVLIGIFLIVIVLGVYLSWAGIGRL
jgi:energy-coupling factor transport system permease protein